MIRVELICDACGCAYVPGPADADHVRIVARMLGWRAEYRGGELRDACATCAGKGGAGDTTEGRASGR